MNIFYILGLSFGGVTLAGIAVIFGYLVKKQEYLKKLPIWVYVLASILIALAFATVALIFVGYYYNKTH